MCEPAAATAAGRSRSEGALLAGELPGGGCDCDRGRLLNGGRESEKKHSQEDGAGEREDVPARRRQDNAAGGTRGHATSGDNTTNTTFCSARPLATTAIYSLKVGRHWWSH